MKSHLRFRRRVILPVGVSVAVAAAMPFLIAVPVKQASGLAGAPPFGFTVTSLTSRNASHGIIYNVSIGQIWGGSVNASGVQIFVGSPANFTVVPFQAILFSGLGSGIAAFNSSRSSWNGSSDLGNKTLYSMGGWVSGSTARVSSGDTLEILSNQRPTYYFVEIAMSPIAQPDELSIASLPA